MLVFDDGLCRGALGSRLRRHTRAGAGAQVSGGSGRDCGFTLFRSASCIARRLRAARLTASAAYPTPAFHIRQNPVSRAGGSPGRMGQALMSERRPLDDAKTPHPRSTRRLSLRTHASEPCDGMRRYPRSSWCHHASARKGRDAVLSVLSCKYAALRPAPSAVQARAIRPSSRPSNNRRPSTLPWAGSTTRSGWGIMPSTLPVSLRMPAIPRAEPLTSSA